ncbi:MAG: hypothetical protein NXI12_02880 [Alphaproteobacteria bacterium]|nr:hypothetical protein [Alphaproteobacteria bacterium]
MAIGWRRYKGNASDMIAAARELRQQEAPAPDRELAGMLATMNAALVTGRQSEAEARLRLGAYVQRLREWPRDVVAEVLHAWPDRNKYWPAWAELRAELERVARPRRTLIADLEWAAATLEPERRAELPMFALKRL